MYLNYLASYDNQGSRYIKEVCLNYLESYDDFTIYVIKHGGHIGFLAARLVVAIYDSAK